MNSSISSIREHKYGIVRNLSIRYLMIKEKLNSSYNIINDNSHNDKFTSQLISQKDRIELQNFDSPKYMDIYERCSNLLKDFESEFNKLQEEHQKQVNPNFNEVDIKIINQNVKEISERMTQQLKKCRALTKELKLLLTKSSLDDNVKTNMFQNLLNRIAYLSRELQIHAELHIQKYNDINKGEENSFFASNNNIFNNNYNTNNNYDSIETNQTQLFYNNSAKSKKIDIVKERNKEIDVMIKSVNELKDIFQEASNLVIFQGTILDRIDYNIFHSRDSIRRGNRELEESNERMKSGFLRKINLILIMAIFIMSILIIFKYF